MSWVVAALVPSHPPWLYGVLGGEARCSTCRRRPRRPRGGRCRRSSCELKTSRSASTPSSQIPPASSASCADLAVERLDDLEHGDLLRRAGERVAALDAALALQQAVAAQGREQLLEELHRHPAALGDLRDRDRALARARELGHRDDRVAGLRGDRDHRRRPSRSPHGVVADAAKNLALTDAGCHATSGAPARMAARPDGCRLSSSASRSKRLPGCSAPGRGNDV